VLHLATNSVIFLLLLDNGVMMTPKHRFLSLIFACPCISKLLKVPCLMYIVSSTLFCFLCYSLHALAGHSALVFFWITADTCMLQLQWLYWCEHLKYIYSMSGMCLLRTSHRAENTGYEWFPIGQGAKYLRLFKDTNCFIIKLKHPSFLRSLLSSNCL